MLFDKFKKIVGKEDKKQAKDMVVKKVKDTEKKPVAKKVVSKIVDGNKRSVFGYKIIKHPIVTEKGSLLGQQNKYLLKIYPNANKTEIREAVNALYNVTVESVNVVNVPRKKRTRGKTEGFKSGFKKAIVTLKKGDKIELV